MSENTTYKQKWDKHGQPLPVSAIRVDTDKCAYDCTSDADYLVKVETGTGETAKFRCCQSCNDENCIWAEQHLPEHQHTDTNTS